MNLLAVNQSLITVEQNWQKIDDELARRNIGRKDTPFNAVLRERMMAAYEHLESLLRLGIDPFSNESFSEICELNNLVHYGTDSRLRQEYGKAILANEHKYYQNLDPIAKWYKKHMRPEPHPLKVAAEIYVSILGPPPIIHRGQPQIWKHNFQLDKHVLWTSAIYT